MKLEKLVEWFLLYRLVMVSAQQKKYITGLVKKYSKGCSTESLLLDITANPRGLPACEEILRIVRAEKDPLQDWLNECCSRNGVDVSLFRKEIAGILEIFSHSGDDADCYRILGVEYGASHAEIKKAYRGLCRKYHPDTAEENEGNNQEKFIKITQAYNTLISPQNKSRENSAAKIAVQQGWRQGKPKKAGDPQRKTTTLIIIGLVVVLLIFSVVSALKYRNQTMLAALQENRRIVVSSEVTSDRSAVTRSEEHKKNENPVSVKKSEETGEYGLIQETGADVVSQLANEETQEPPSEVPRMQESLEDGHIADVECDEESKEGSVGEVDMTRKRAEKAINAEKQPEDDMTMDMPEVVKETPLPDTQKKSFVKKEREMTAQKASGNNNKEKKEPEKRKKGKEIVGASDPGVDGSRETAAVNSEQEGGIPPERAYAQEEDKPHAAPQKEYQAEIEKFIADYIHTYQERNITAFSDFFTPDAEENDKPFASMIPVYRELFEAASEVRLDIKLLFWVAKSGKFYLQGRFGVVLDYKNGKRFADVGPISFILIDDMGALRVKKLKYSFKSHL